MSSNGHEQESGPPQPRLDDDTFEVWQEVLGDLVAQERATLKRERDLFVAQMEKVVAESGRSVSEQQTQMVLFKAELERTIAEHLERVTKQVTELIRQVAERLAVVRDGAPGPKGERGEDGKQGERGEQGERGLQGERGADGAAGIQGAAGERGADGARGDPGDRGEPGPVGPAGDRGAPGAQGERGPEGAPGEIGQAGAQGDPGERGERGPEGAAGPVGQAGERGPIGEAGSCGPAGARGAPGDVGPRGLAGRDGAGIIVGRGPPLLAMAPGTIYLDTESGDVYSSIKYSDDQPRDDDGKWSSGGGGGGDTGGGGKEPKEGDGSKPVAGFSAGVKAKNDNEAVDKAKADWFQASPFRADKFGGDKKAAMDAAVKAAPAEQKMLGDVGRAVAEKRGIEFQDPGVKTDRARIDEKIEQRKGVERVTDLARGGFVVDTPEQAKGIAEEFAKAGFEVAEEPWKPTDLGYADKALQLRGSSGLVAEVQIVERGMYNAKNKEGGHAAYKEQQKIEKEFGKNDPRYQALSDKQRGIYGKVTDSYSSDWREALKLGPKKHFSAAAAASRRSAQIPLRS
jgi:hypothetical protein